MIRKNNHHLKKPLFPIPITHSNKIIYPEDSITKQQIAEYYHIVSNWITPYIVKRPLTLVRCPNNYQEYFYQKHPTGKIPSELFTIIIEEKSGHEKDEYIYLKNSSGLLQLIQLGVIEIHPWSSTIKDLEKPDTIIFDLDPAPRLAWKKVVAAAFQIKSILAGIKLTSFVKVTGGKGLHIEIPIKPKYTWEEIRSFAKILVDYLVMVHPDKYIGIMTKEKRSNKIFIDYLRNQRGATAIAPYSLRTKIHAPVASPIAWDELTNDIRDTTFTLKTMPKRLMHLKQDPWIDFFSLKQALNFTHLT